MSDKSYVTMEQCVCVVCGQPYDTGSILMDKRMRNTFERNTITGWGMCPEHEKLRDDGYVAMVGCDADKSEIVDGVVKPDGAHRTGVIGHLRKEVFVDMFGNEPPKGMVVFCDTKLMDKLEQLKGECENGQDE